MPKIYPTVIKRTTITAGGGGTALIRWGPNFGTLGGDSLPQAQTLALTEIGVGADLPQVHTVSLTDLQVTTGVAQVQAVALSEIGVGSAVAQVQAVTMTAFEVGADVAQVQTVAMPAIGVGANVAQVATLGGTARGEPFYIGKTTASASGATSLVCNKPAGAAVGDLIVAVMGTLTAFPGVPAVTAPAGFLAVGSSGLNEDRIQAFRRILDGTEGSTFTFTTGTAIGEWVGDLHLIRGADQTTPINATALTEVNVADPVAPAVSPTVANCLVLATTTHQHLTTQSHIAPAGHLERSEQEQGVVPFSLSSYTRTFAASGSTGTATIDCSTLVPVDARILRVAVAPGDVTL